MTFEEDYYERGWRDALAFAAKEGRKMVRVLAKQARGAHDVYWHSTAEAGAAEALRKFAEALSVASIPPKPEPTDAEAAEFPEGFTS